MKRKHSIALGIGALVSAAYLVLVGVYLYGIMQENRVGLQALIVQTTLEELTPHLVCALVGVVLIAIAFFSSSFLASLLSFLCFGGAVVLALGDYYQYAVLCAPALLFAFIGCFYCHKRKKILKEEAEERDYQEYHAKVKAASQKKSNQRQNIQREPMVQTRQRRNSNAKLQHQAQSAQSGNETSFAQRNQNYYRQAYQQSFAPQSNHYNNYNYGMMPQNYGYPYAPNPYGNDPLIRNVQTPSFYDPLVFNQTDQPQNPQGVQQNNAMINQGNGASPFPYQQPTPQSSPAFSPADFQVSGRERTLADGYFDDYGNFHPGNGNNF